VSGFVKPPRRRILSGHNVRRLDQLWLILMVVNVREAGTPLVMLRALAEPLRWRIVVLLASEELCVCHLVEELGAAQPLVSHHLGVLRRAGLVEPERFRYWTYYRLRPQALDMLAAEFSRLAQAAPQPGRVRRECC
jgi:ArsR family transcriptional regulator